MYPVLFEIFGFPISTFGVMVALGFLAGGWMAARSFERAGLKAQAAWDVVTLAVVGGIAGAKLWFVVETLTRDPDTTLRSLLFDFDTCRGGLTWYGGFLGGTVLCLIGARRYQLPLLAVANCSAPSLAIGQALGRVGCFLVGDDYGRPSDVPWAVAFPEGLPPTLERVHPTMLYETFWLLPVGAFLWWRRGRSPFLFGEYLMLAGFGRLCIEAYRVNPPVIGPFTNAQLVALACMVIGALGWMRLRARR